MNYNKVIKDLKERNNKLQEQYRLRDIRCIHLEYENEMLKGDFEAQHELTKKYAKENQKYKEVIEKAIYFINNNGEKQYNHHDNYRGKWYSPDELDTILDILKEVE